MLKSETSTGYIPLIHKIKKKHINDEKKLFQDFENHEM